MTAKRTEDTQAQQSDPGAQQDAAAGFGPQAWGSAFWGAGGTWQQLIAAQMNGLETAMTQAERLVQRQLGRAQAGVDESARLARGAIDWVTEVQAELTKATLEAVRAAAARVAKAA